MYRYSMLLGLCLAMAAGVMAPIWGRWVRCAPGSPPRARPCVAPVRRARPARRRRPRRARPVRGPRRVTGAAGAAFFAAAFFFGAARRRALGGLEAAEQVLRRRVAGAQDPDEQLLDRDVVRRHLGQPGVDLAGGRLPAGTAERGLGEAHEVGAALAQVLQRRPDVGAVAALDRRRLRLANLRRRAREAGDDRGVEAATALSAQSSQPGRRSAASAVASSRRFSRRSPLTRSLRVATNSGGGVA